MIETYFFHFCFCKRQPSLHLVVLGLHGDEAGLVALLHGLHLGGEAFDCLIECLDNGGELCILCLQPFKLALA